MVTATGVVTITEPSAISERTKALMLLVSPSSQGICAVTLSGATATSGAGIPLKKTCVPPSLVGSVVAEGDETAVFAERFVPARKPGCREQWKRRRRRR